MWHLQGRCQEAKEAESWLGKGDALTTVELSLAAQPKLVKYPYRLILIIVTLAVFMHFSGGHAITSFAVDICQQLGLGGETDPYLPAIILSLVRLAGKTVLSKIYHKRN